MKARIVLLTSLSFSIVLGQDSTIVSVVQATTWNVGSAVLSTYPTTGELAQLFSSGEVGPEEAVRLAVEKGQASVSGISELLLSGIAVQLSGSATDTVTALPNRLLMLEALSKIGTENVVPVLIAEGRSERVSQLKAVALNNLAHPLYESLRGSISPSKDVVFLFIENLGDSTWVGTLQRTIGQISQEGLVEWLGLDFGDPVFADARKAAGSVSTAEYAANWWRENQDNLIWNQIRGHFEVKQ